MRSFLLVLALSTSLMHCAGAEPRISSQTKASVGGTGAETVSPECAERENCEVRCINDPKDGKSCLRAAKFHEAEGGGLWSGDTKKFVSMACDRGVGDACAIQASRFWLDVPGVKPDEPWPDSVCVTKRTLHRRACELGAQASCVDEGRWLLGPEMPDYSVCALSDSLDEDCVARVKARHNDRVENHGKNFRCRDTAATGEPRRALTLFQGACDAGVAEGCSMAARALSGDYEGIVEDNARSRTLVERACVLGGNSYDCLSAAKHVLKSNPPKAAAFMRKACATSDAKAEELVHEGPYMACGALAEALETKTIAPLDAEEEFRASVRACTFDESGDARHCDRYWKRFGQRPLPKQIESACAQGHARPACFVVYMTYRHSDPGRAANALTRACGLHALSFPLMGGSCRCDARLTLLEPDAPTGGECFPPPPEPEPKPTGTRGRKTKR